MMRKQKKSIWRKLWIGFIVIIIAVSVVACQSSGDYAKDVFGSNVDKQAESNNGDITDADETTEHTKKPIVAEPVESTKSEKTEEPVEEKNAEEDKSGETLSQKNAIRMANDYLKFTSFSKSGLIKQLEFEGFNEEDAAYAVNQLDVDWKEQAVYKAEDYLKFSAFSKSGLIEQLRFEGFSEEEATYAVNQLDIDWKEQAVKKAEDYLDFSAFSRKGLIEQLEFEGFTKDEAIYAVDIIGL